jgi:hypothetical protein
MVGRSGSTGERVSAANPSARNRRDLMNSIEPGVESNMTWTCPASRSG